MISILESKKSPDLVKNCFFVIKIQIRETFFYEDLLIKIAEKYEIFESVFNLTLTLGMRN